MLLALDTALSACSVGLYDIQADALVSHDVQMMEKGHAEALVPLMAQVMEGFSFSDLTRIGVTIGPGSYTGLRVALSSARALAVALAIPVVGISTLEALAFPFSDCEDVIAVIDARHGRVYAQGFGRSSFGPGLMNVQDVPVTGHILTGPGTFLYGLAVQSPAPDLLSLARLAILKDPGDFPPDPLYLREADALPFQGAIARI